MNIRCIDGKIRGFIPADNAAPHVRVNNMKITPAYCVHCNTIFSSKPTIEQKEVWRQHICEGHVYGSANTKVK